MNVTSNGVVTLTNVSASKNGTQGAYISNGASAVNIKYSGTGSNHFDGNGSTGISLITTGAVTFGKVYASDNNGDGATIDNSAGTATNVTINTGTFSNNVGFGFDVYTNGAIAVTSVTANGNGFGGVRIVSANSTAPKAVTVYKSQFNENDGRGLDVNTHGTITLNNVTASENDLYGAYLQNQAGTAGVNVLSTYGANNFNGNIYRGLYILSKGAIVLNSVTASDNQSYGVYIDNYQLGDGIGSVSLTKVTTWSNYYYGIYVLTNGATIINTASSAFNGVGGDYSGIHVETNGHNLVVSNSLVTSNQAYGIRGLLGIGVFTISNTYYYGNNVTDGGFTNLYITH